MGLQIRIAILFAILIFGSFIPDYLHGFFGDWYCATGSGPWIHDTEKVAGHYEFCSYTGEHSPCWHWGLRHLYFFFAVIVLFIVNCVQLLLWIQKKRPN